MRHILAAALALLVALAGCGGRAGSGYDLVVISPHDEKITQEFTRAFSEHFRAVKGREPSISFRDLGSGTETQVKFILDQFARSPEGIGVDVFFGGGPDVFRTLKDKGVLATYAPANTSTIPAELLGVPLYDRDHAWHGAVLSSFGILYNRETLKRLGVAEPKTWEDMADARLAKHVGLADPSRSGSARAIYETILQAYGWDKGWRVLTLMAANSVDFYEGSSSLAKDVTLGEIAVGPVIDYYGRTQVAEAGGDRLGYVTPASLTVITPDPIAILKGAPNSETARMFVDFVLSDAGQKLWLVKAGAPGGPKEYSLMRMPILPKVYDECPRADWTVDANPFEFKGSFSFDSEKGSRRRAVVLDLMKSTLIQPQNELRSCWTAVRRVVSPAPNSLPLPEGLVAQMVRMPVTQAECLKMSDVQWTQEDFRSRTMTDWVRFAIRKYADVEAAAR